MVPIPVIEYRHCRDDGFVKAPPPQKKTSVMETDVEVSNIQAVAGMRSDSE